MELRRPKFAEFDKAGRLVALFCRVCGSCIGATVGGQFRHRANYTEVTIRFSDGSRHVANGCLECMSAEMEAEELQGIYEADIALQPNDYTPRDRLRKVAALEGVASLSDIRGGF